jgi:ppGpp synthetase/RelA/SpoT-type nucleotidyltranferase
MAWTKPQHTKGRVDWAGDVLSKESRSEYDDYVSALEIVNNWRTVHSYPLQATKMTLKKRAKRICPSAIVAQRLKRLPSIALKLKLSREAGRHPQLSQMQDIGGCRAVLETVEQVRQLQKVFEEAAKKSPHRGPQHFRTSDYIEHPKANGYRSLHLVYKFRSDSPQHSCYNGQRIEIQLRSRWQHYWATAVETYSTFTGEALKSNIGSEEWTRFFALMASAIAIREGCAAVEHTPATLEGLRPELFDLYMRLNVHNVLAGWTAITRMTKQPEIPPQIAEAAMYLLKLDVENFQVDVTAYTSEELEDANDDYARIEKEQGNVQTVLVSVDSIAALRTAYPNYFLDTSAFLALVDEILEIERDTQAE